MTATTVADDPPPVNDDLAAADPPQDEPDGSPQAVPMDVAPGRPQLVEGCPAPGGPNPTALHPLARAAAGWWAREGAGASAGG